jgi:hypothetical protein
MKGHSEVIACKEASHLLFAAGSVPANGDGGMVTLAKTGIQVGINLHLSGRTVVFTHRWLLVAGEKE